MAHSFFQREQIKENADPERWLKLPQTRVQQLVDASDRISRQGYYVYENGAYTRRLVKDYVFISTNTNPYTITTSTF